MSRFTFLWLAAIAVVSCSEENPEEQTSGIPEIVYRHTGFDLKPYSYTIVTDEITHENISLNYRRETVLEFDAENFDKLITEIEATPYFGVIGIDNSRDWKMWDTTAPLATRGLWISTLQGYTFLYRNDGQHVWAPKEDLAIIVKTASRTVTTTFYDNTH